MALLSRVIDIRVDERRDVVLAFATLLCLIAGHTVLETARDALFLRRLPADRLTFVYLGLAAVGLVVPIYNTRFARALGRRNAAIFTLMAAAFGTTLWHLQARNATAAYGIYLWSGLLGTVMVVQFWMLLGQRFTVGQGKRLFAGIAAGGVAGAVLGGLLAAAVLQVVHDVRVLLLVAAALFVATALVLTALPSPEAGPDRRAARRGVGHPRAEPLRQYPYALRLGALVAVSTAALLATDYLFKYEVKARVDPAELGRFFAGYYAALNAVALVVQLALAQRLLQRVGVVSALLLLPLLLLGGAGGLLLAGGGLVMVLLTKGADGALRHSLHRVGVELLYLPLSAAVRERAKSFIDAVCTRGVQALTAGSILLLALLGLQSVRVLAIMVAALVVGWLLLTVALRRSYLDLFRQQLRRGAVSPELLRVEDLDLDSIESLTVALSSPEPERVIAAMRLLDEAGRARLIPSLVLYHPHDEVLLAALEILSRAGARHWRAHAARLARQGSEAVRIEAVRALGCLNDRKPIEQALADVSPAVRAQAAFQLVACDDSQEPLEHPALRALLDQTDEGDEGQRDAVRLALLRALERDADARWADVLVALASSEQPEVVRSVARAAVRVPDARLVPLLVERLALRRARRAIGTALVRHGEIALEALAAALADPGMPDRVRRYLPLVIAAFGSQRAADVLVGAVEDESSGAVRYRILRGLTRLVASHPVRIDAQVIERELERNLAEHLRLGALLAALAPKAERASAGPSELLLTGLLEDKMRQALERAFRLIKLLHPREDVRGIFDSLAVPETRRRAAALEFLETLMLTTGERCRSLLRVATDDLGLGERIERAAVLLDALPRSVDEAMAELLADRDHALAALAVYHAVTIRAPGARRLAEAAVARRPALGFAAQSAGLGAEVAHA